MYDHYIALDWAQSVMAIARISKHGKKEETLEMPSDIKELKFYLSSKKGSKLLTFEESTCAQWLYSELRTEVDELVICDPRRNRYLTEAQQTDKIDARKLAQLAQAGLLKPVFHSGDQFIYFRKLVSGYNDTIRAGVRLKNQKSAVLRANGTDQEDEITHDADRFVLAGLNKNIELYETEKQRYQSEFAAMVKKHPVLKRLTSVPGIGEIGAVQIGSRVVDARRFPSKGQFYAYCGLVKYEKMSGGRSYGKRRTSYSRELKNVFDTAAHIILMKPKPDTYMGQYIGYLQDKRYPDHQIKRAISRHVAAIALGVMKGKKFDPNYRNAKAKERNLT